MVSRESIRKGIVMNSLMNKLQEIVGTLTTDPEKQHYVNYISCKCGEKLYVGPYPYTVADLLARDYIN